MAKAARADLDGAWKDSLIGLLPWFLKRHFPHIHADIDWTRGYELLDKELQKIMQSSATGPRRADLLFKVWLLSGEQRWVLIHIEIQAQPQIDFSERVFEYHGLIKHVYRRPVASFGVLADDDPEWRPGPYVYDQWGCGGEFHFPMVKLLDFAGREAELEKDNNPFSVVVLAHLKARETTGDRARRREWKFRLLQGLYNRGWEHNDVLQLLRTIDWFLTLPREDERWVFEAIEADEQEKQVPYITSIERMVEERGKKLGEKLGEARGKKLGEARGKKLGEARGRAEGLKDGIALALKLKFGNAAKSLIVKVRRRDDLETLNRVHKTIEKATAIEEIRRLLQ